MEKTDRIWPLDLLRSALQVLQGALLSDGPAPAWLRDPNLLVIESTIAKFARNSEILGLTWLYMDLRLAGSISCSLIGATS